jgi:DNA mismatch repair protein MutS2
MVYPDNFEEKVEFNKIREMAKDICLSPLGRRKVEEAEFSASYDIVKQRIDETCEMREICINEENFPAGYYYDATPWLKRVKLEGTFLEINEIFDLKRSLETIRAIIRFFKITDEKKKYPALRKLAREIKFYPAIIEKIDSIITKAGKIRDKASPHLYKIRKEIQHKQIIIDRKLVEILKSVIHEGFIDKGTNFTLRNGRHVIPVPSNYKRMIKGYVHDESASGKTSFIEPAEIVELNNDIKELEYEERREIIRILTGFTDSVRPYLDDLLQSYDFLGTIDFIRAKAMLAVRINAVKSVLFDTQSFRWDKAVHPLLFLTHKKENKEVVPLSICLDNKNRILLISGPNAGGKSVCLKTVGLLQYMLQCGFLVPMSENSETGIFKDIFIDIGDEQSLEHDLSTYSSHLLNMKHFTKNAGPLSLVLIDEFGSGTEPALGGAIAEAILDTLNQNSTFGVITTHYTNLKHFASSAPSIINGAMLFDTNKMQPLFKLQIGKPGSSFAIDIARQIGLPEKILKLASEKIGEDHIRFDKHLREILRDKRYWEEKRNKIRIAGKNLESIIDRYSRELNEAGKLRKEIIDKATREAEEILSGANREIENTVKKIKESQAEKEKTRQARKELEEYKQTVRDTANVENQQIQGKLNKLREQEKRLSKVTVDKDFKVKAGETGTNDNEIITGDKVRLSGQETIGEVLDVNKDSIMVAFGNMITTVKAGKLEKITDEEISRLKKSGHISSVSSFNVGKRKLNFKPAIDVRGKKGDEALDIIRSYIDDATMVSATEVKILHGKGNGILKQLIRDYLDTIEIVKSYKDEHVDRGGAGITVVTLDI